MHHSLFPVIAMLALPGLLIAQQPRQEVGPPGQGAGAGPTISRLDPCSVAEAFIDVETPTKDSRIVGVAHARDAGRWLFSGANNGNPRIYVADEGAEGKPDMGTIRSFPFRGQSQFWGARDLAYDAVTGMVYHGDEADTIWEIDPQREAYTGRSVRLTGSASGTIRALAITDAPGGQAMRIAQCDWNNPVEVWDIDRARFTATRVRQTYTNPGTTYGAAFAVHGAVLILFGQRQHSCVPGRGLHLLTAIDARSGNVLGTRAGDFRIPGPTPNTAGGVAAGIELTTVSGQIVAAVLHQAVNDSVGFVPLTGYGHIGPPDCGGRLLPTSNAMLGNRDFGLRIAGGPSKGIAALMVGLPPLAGIRLGSCTLDVDPISGVLLPPFSLDPMGMAELRIPLPADPALDGVRLVFDALHTSVPVRLPLQSTNPVVVQLAVGAWRQLPLPRCLLCRPITRTVNECLHFVNDPNGTPCSTTECIENQLDSATCLNIWFFNRPPNCDTDRGTGPEVVQTARAMPCPSMRVRWRHWLTLWWGCGTNCDRQQYFVACVIERCAGRVTRGPFNRGTKKVCGCP